MTLLGIITVSFLQGGHGENYIVTLFIGWRVMCDCGLPSTSLTGEAAIAVRIRAYGASGHLALEESNVLQGTRLLHTCDVKELPESYVVVSYKWYHSCSTGRCEIQRESSYYTPVNDTLLVDATSWGDGKRRHTCDVEYRSAQGSSRNLTGFITHVRLTG